MRIFAVLLLLPALALADRCGDAFGNALFPLISRDNDFIITRAEFLEFVKLFDTDRDGKLFFSEFVVAVKTRAPLFVGNELLLYFVLTNNKAGRIVFFINDAFNRRDNNRNSAISLQELQSVFSQGLVISLNVTNILVVNVEIGK